jgi:hypothetical protein
VSCVRRCSARAPKRVLEVFGKVAMQPVEHAHQVRGQQLLDGKEAHLVLADRLETAVHGQRMKVDVNAQILTMPHR